MCELLLLSFCSKRFIIRAGLVELQAGHTAVDTSSADRLVDRWRQRLAVHLHRASEPSKAAASSLAVQVTSYQVAASLSS